VPIDVPRVLAAQLPTVRSTWEPDDVILYHLGIGAGARPTDPAELAYVYEGALHVLPSFAVIPAFGWLPPVEAVDGLDIDPALLLHGEQELELAGALPTSGAIETTGCVTDVWDKGSGAIFVFEVTSRDVATGEIVFVNRFSSFVRGEGGFGGEGGPAAANHPPERGPDAEVACPTLPQQALLYRLSGDKNPLHADPAFAARGGFDQPILHGLCSYGIACKAAVDALLDGDVAQVAGYRARFAGVVFPGETLVVRLWDEGERIVVAVHTKERQSPVISNAAITLRSKP
jgi:acyl dehydratase